MTIRIRGGSSISGDNEPLIVIDNFPSNKEALTQLNPGDVLSMEVLKDASATAIFGSRGANGVIMVTTKKGQDGRPSLSVNLSQGILTPRRYIPMMDGPEFAQYSQAAMVAHGFSVLGQSGNASNTFRPDTLGTFDGQRMMIKDMANRRDYNISLSGGTRDMQYRLSGGYQNEEGLLNNSNNERITGRFRFTGNMTPKLYFNLSASVGYRLVNQILGGSDQGAVLRGLLIRPNTMTAGEFNDGLFTDPETGEITSVSTELAVAMKNKRERKEFNTSVNGEFRWTITPDISFSVNGGYNFMERKTYSFMSPEYFLTADQRNRYPDASRGSNGSMKWVNENVLTFNKEFGKHGLDLILGQSWEKSMTDPFSVAVYGFTDGYTGWDNLGASTFISPTVPSSSYDKNTLISFFTRARYSYDQRYMFTVSFRSDGSSRFGKDRKFGYFPSAAAAWNVMNEGFAKDWNAFSSLRLRASYGVTGNDKIGNYLSQSMLTPISVIVGADQYSGMQASRLGNEDLQWETTEQYNVGFDIGLLRGRITMAFDAYLKKTYNLLYSYRIPGSNGYTTVMRNVGNIDNRGVEFEITSHNIKNRNFSWTTEFNIGYNDSKVTDLGGNDEIVLYNMGGIVNSDVTFLKVGHPLGIIKAHKTSIYRNWEEVYSDSAIWNEDPSSIPTVPGMIRYHDRNGDGVIDDNDRVIVGQVQPYLMGGMTHTFTFKNFDLVLFFNYAYGNSIVDANAARLDMWRANNYGQTRRGLESYRHPNFYTGDIGYTSDAKYPVPAAYGGSSISQNYEALFNDYYVQDGSYLRLKTLTLGYTFPQKIAKKLHMGYLRIALSGMNLLTFTKYMGMDPEMSSSMGSSNSRLGIDQSSYPAARVYTLNFNCRF